MSKYSLQELLKENKKLKEKMITREMVLIAYENEISNQAIDHPFDFDNVLNELFGEE